MAEEKPMMFEEKRKRARADLRAAQQQNDEAEQSRQKAVGQAYEAYQQVRKAREEQQNDEAAVEQAKKAQLLLDKANQQADESYRRLKEAYVNAAGYDHIIL